MACFERQWRTNARYGTAEDSHRHALAVIIRQAPVRDQTRSHRHPRESGDPEAHACAHGPGVTGFPLSRERRRGDDSSAWEGRFREWRSFLEGPFRGEDGGPGFRIHGISPPTPGATA